MFHIVDDEEHIREFLVEVIGLMGYEAEAFGCPAMYADYAASPEYETPYALLTDVQMPKMNGYELLDRVKSIHPEVRTAIISGYPKYEGEAKVRSCTFLIKPVDIDKLGRMIESFVNCHINGPDAEMNGCGVRERVEEFKVEKWSCPHAKQCKNC